MNTKSIFQAMFLVVASVGMASAATAGQAKADADTVKITGQVSCTKFAGPVIPRKGFTIAETIHLCISQGYDYTIVDGRKVYPLIGNKNELAKLAGETVTVMGRLNPDLPKGSTYALMGSVEASSVVPTKN